LRPRTTCYIRDVGVRFLDDAARAAFERAIRDVEEASAVEVVVAVRRRSAGYRHANAIVGGVLAFAGLAAMLFSSHTFRLSSILVDPFVVAALGAAAVELLPQVKRLLTPRGARHASVLAAARATFVERGIHDTRDRSGLLVYISWLEQQVVVVADRGIERLVAREILVRAEQDLTAAMRRGGAAVASVISALAPALARALPCRPDDINELPDAIDSDLERKRRR
jgi:putative membrane protein